MYTALYRSQRPEVFDEILGQEHIVKILKNQIKTGTTGHAYLFCGTRGTGKTSTARILSKALNCTDELEQRPCGKCANCLSVKDGNFIDVIEIDAASNNGVDNIRELRESVKYPPAIGRCKVYIIDEVHMLSTGAFNALLKTLEEPPENVVFILATTEVQKLPATILSRCLRLDFKRVPEKIIKDGMAEICSNIGIEISDAALGIIAANADGSVRDALSLLDQCISSSDKKVERQDVIEILGTAGDEAFIEITQMVMNRQVSEALLFLNTMISEGKDVRQFIKDWINHFRNLLMTKFINSPEDIINMSSENVDRIRKQSESVDIGFINDSIIKLSQTMAEAKWSTQPRILLELCIVNLALEKTDLFKQREPQNPNSVGVANVVINKEEKQKAKIQVQEKSILTENENKINLSSKTNIDFDKLWHSIFEAGESIKGSFNFLRTGAKLKAVHDNYFLVEASSEITLTYLENNAKDLEELMANQLGRALRLECRLAGCEKELKEDKGVEDIANQIGNKFGLQIDIQ